MIKESQLILDVIEKMTWMRDYTTVVVVESYIASHLEEELDHKVEEFCNVLRTLRNTQAFRNTSLKFINEIWKEDISYIREQFVDKGRTLFVVDRHSQKSVNSLLKEGFETLVLPLEITNLVNNVEY